MKKTNTNNNPPAKDDISVLKADVSELKTDVSVMKTDVSVLKADVSELKTDVSELRIDLKKEIAFVKIDFNETFEKFDEKNRRYRDQLLTGLDKVMKELEKMREDNIVRTKQIRTLRVDVDNHEKRIKVLELSTKKN